MPINKYGVSYFSANDPDHLEWSHPCNPSTTSRPKYLHPQYRSGGYQTIDHLKVYSLRKVENQVAHGGQIWHNTETGNNRVFFIGAQVREQRRLAALIHGEDSEKVRRIGRETMQTYQSEADAFRRFGTKPEFNGYDVKSNWKIVSYEEADKNESVLELTGDRTGNTIDEDLKFHFSRFEGNAEQAVKDVANYRYYFKLASVKGDPKVQMATHRNSKRFWDECRAEEQRLLENELLEQEANIEIPIPSNNSEIPSLVKDEEFSDNESCASMDTVIDVSLEVHADDEQNVSFSKSFSDDALSSKVIFFDPSSHNLKECIVDVAPQAPGILASSIILGKVIQAKDSVVVRRRSRVPKNIMNFYNSSSSSLSDKSSSSQTPAAAAAVSQETAAAASNEAQSIALAPVAEEEEVYPPPPQFITPPPQPMLVTAPVSINFELSESAPTVTPPSPFANNWANRQQQLNKQLVEVRQMGKGLDKFSDEFTAYVSSTLEKRKTPPPVMLSVAEPEFRSISTNSDGASDAAIKALEDQVEEYHVAAEIDAEKIEKLETENRKHKKARFKLGNSINTLRVAGSAMSLIVNDSLRKFNTNRLDMDLVINESHSSTGTCPQVSIEARKSNKSVNDCLLSPKCDTNSTIRCTHCELQWVTSLLSVIWNDAMNVTGLDDADFLVDHFDPCAENGPPPDYFSKPGELSLRELDYSKLVVKRSCDSSPIQQRTRRRIDSEEVLSADDSVDRESLEIKREVVETYRVEVERSVWTDSEQFDVDSDAESTEPEVSEIPLSDNDEMC